MGFHKTTTGAAALAGLMITSAACASAQSHRVTRISPDTLRQPAEVAVAINPTDPDNIVAVGLAEGKTAGVRVTNYAFVTVDGGDTWVTTAAPNPAQRVQGDDAIAFDADGNAYRSYISFEGIRVDRPERAENGIFVSRSPDGGISWLDPVPVVDHINTVEPFEDKPWIAADRVEDSPCHGNLYVAWTRFDVYGSADPADSTAILFARSTDGGRSFSVPHRISEQGGNAVDSDSTVEGAVPSIGVDGTVYIAWAGPLGIVLDRSRDCGWTFGEDRVVDDMPGGWDIPVAGLTRHNGMPVTAVDHSDGPHRGSLYINWIDTRNGDPDVFVLASRDGGESWEGPVRVNQGAPRDGEPQLFTWMAVDPVDGAVNIVFLDRDAEGTGVVLARSVDGGRSFRTYSVDQPRFGIPADVFYGDYTGIDARGGRVVLVYPRPGAEEGRLEVAAAVFDFEPGTLEAVRP
jgi:hypothetical protein